MKVVSISTVLLLIVINFSCGLPPLRRYEYDYGNSGHRQPLAFGTRFGSRYGDVPRGLGDRSNWCPLRARDALRLTAPPQGFPPASRSQGPGYFNNPSEDDDGGRRYGRSHQTDSNVNQANDFNDVDNPDWNDDGVDVGGVFWPRREIKKMNPLPDCGCHHDKIATLAKDATAAASNAAIAAAAAAKAAAAAAAAAVCGPENTPDDHVERDNPTDFNSGGPADDKLEYPNNVDDNGGEDTFQDDDDYQDDVVNSHDDENNHKFVLGTGSEEISKDATNNDVFSRENSKNEISSVINTGSPNSLRVTESKEFSQRMNGGREFSKDTTKSESRRINGSITNSQGVIDSGLPKKSTVNTEFSQGINANEMTSRKDSGNGGNLQGLKYNNINNISQGTSGMNAWRNAGTEVDTHATTGKAMYSPDNIGSGIHSYSKNGSGVTSQGAARTGVYHQGSNSNGVYSQGSTGSKVVTFQESNSTNVNPKDDKTHSGEDNLPDEIKKNFTSSVVSNVQSIPPHVVRDLS